MGSILSSRGRTLIVDADMGVGNAHILQDVSPQRSFVDVAAGRCDVREAVTACRADLDLVSAGSGVSRMAGLSPYELHLIAGGIEELETDYDFVLVDSAAGISEQTLAFAAACDQVLVVTTPDLTAMTDAYAFIKVLFGKRPDLTPLLVVNRVDESAGEHSGTRVAERIGHVCLKFLGMEPHWLGSIPEDRAVVRSVAARRPVVLGEPGSHAAVALQALCVPVVGELSSAPHGGLGHRLAAGTGFRS
jgi:flagellar biosynthesis protein FlhG